MISLLTSCELFLRLGLVYSILAMGYYVSYTILDFPDLTVEGTFLGGAVMYGIFVSHGISGWLGIIAAFAVIPEPRHMVRARANARSFFFNIPSSFF